jgi:uncharacterized protein YifN (PemK superfamily)
VNANKGIVMAINFSPKVGQILDCNYGHYPRDKNGFILDNIVDAHMPPEMVKRRLVIVLNGKLNGNSSIVVPLSTTKDEIKLKRGIHVQLDAGIIEDLRYFSPVTCWAKCDMVQTVSNNRLNKPMLAARGWLSQCIPSPIITLIQQAIVNSIKISENSIHGTQSI